MTLKPDPETPQWEEFDAERKPVHDWRRYINAELRELWTSFTSEQKRAIARNAQELADQEDWD